MAVAQFIAATRGRKVDCLARRDQNVSRRKRLAVSRQEVSFQLPPAPDKHLSAHPAVQLRLLTHFRTIITSRYQEHIAPRFGVLSARNFSVPSPCVRLSRTPWTDVTPSSTMDPLSLQAALVTCPPIPDGKLLQLPALLA